MEKVVIIMFCPKCGEEIEKECQILQILRYCDF